MVRGLRRFRRFRGFRVWSFRDLRLRTLGFRDFRLRGLAVLQRASKVRDRRGGWWGEGRREGGSSFKPSGVCRILWTCSWAG